VWLACASPAVAHDTWVETNTNLIRSGDAVYVDLKLGNHGNNHRDFKLAGKPDVQASTLEIVAPNGGRYDLKDRLLDTGYAPAEGYWKAKFAAVEPGLYCVIHSHDKVVHYAPTRSVKSAKTFFVVSGSLDRVSQDNPGFDRVFGHALELVPASNPVTPMGPGQALRVQLLYKGQPMPDATVSFIPRGETLQEGFDATYERKTDSRGEASFTPKTGNVYLVVAHHREPAESGENYENTKYSATLVVFVPELCPCCGE
jgi:uncharacterized GH25 family protein